MLDGDITRPETRLATIPFDRLRRFAAAKTGVSVRPFPFPYAAGLAVANDCDEQDRLVFEDWHGFVCGRGETPYGEGLGLEVGDSFAIDSESRRPVFGTKQTQPDDAAVDRLIGLADAGWLDTIRVHDPDQWLSNRDAIASLGLKPAILSIAEMPGGITAHGAAVFEGFRCIAYDAFVERDVFGVHIDHRFTRGLRTAIASYDWSQWSGDWLQRQGENETATEDRLLDRFNAALNGMEAKDGSPIQVLKRYIGEYAPSMDCFSTQLRSQNLLWLAYYGGVAFVQAKFGIRSLVGRHAPHDSRRTNAVPALDRDAAGAWREIAKRNADGELFIATTARMLDWIEARETFELTVEEGESRWTIDVDNSDENTDDSMPHGFALVVPEDAPEIAVRFGKARKTAILNRDPDPRRPGMHCLWSEWHPLVWPDAERG